MEKTIKIVKIIWPGILDINDIKHAFNTAYEDGTDFEVTEIPDQSAELAESKAREKRMNVALRLYSISTEYEDVDDDIETKTCSECEASWPADEGESHNQIKENGAVVDCPVKEVG